MVIIITIAAGTAAIIEGQQFALGLAFANNITAVTGRFIGFVRPP
jgi:hypothetical protein